MPTTSLEHQKNLRRLVRSRAKLAAANQSIPRISVHRSLRHISAQLIDDQKGVTLTASTDLTAKGTKTEQAKTVGTALAKQALALGITAVRFDRGANVYHGRVAALADAARQAGLIF